MSLSTTKPGDCHTTQQFQLSCLFVFTDFLQNIPLPAAIVSCLLHAIAHH
jgi:hypothetical protein